MQRQKSDNRIPSNFKQPHLSSEFIAEMKQRLLETKKKLEEDLKGLTFHTEIGNDPGENAEEEEMDELNQTLMVKIKRDLEKINEALARIERGTYGLDEEGKPISEKRLRAIPWADRAI